MDFQRLKGVDKENIMGTYARFELALTSGKGAEVEDIGGRSYIDFTSGIGVNSLGFCDEQWSNAVAQQAQKLNHVSNLYYSSPQVKLAQRLCELTGLGKVFFCNSGAEANECAVKIARKYGADKYGGGRNEIITLLGSFHGRTVTTLSATGQPSLQQGFSPLTGGFCYARVNDIDSVRSLLNDKTVAIMLELIQGEGGVVPLDKGFVSAVAEICGDRDILLIVDEVQTGAGRTGSFVLSEQYGVTPDILTLAKGLGGGLPIGACLCKDNLQGVLTPGTHGTTYGGNPIVCAGALQVLERAGNREFLREVKLKGEYITQKLKGCAKVSEVRGAGLMIGLALTDITAKQAALECLEMGLLVLTAKDILRLLPPLTIGYEEIDKGIDLLTQVLN